MINEKSPIHERFNHLYKVISSERFLQMQGLGNEVPFFICPFMPEDNVDMQRQIIRLVNQLDQHGISVLRIDLYDLIVEILKSEGIWEKILEIEKKTSKDRLKETLQGVLDTEKYLIPAIVEKMKQVNFDVLFLTGVGEVFPYIRSHNVLNNLQSKAKDEPTILFFPGEYTFTKEGGASLDLFGRLHDDKYYRAFNIFHWEV